MQATTNDVLNAWFDVIVIEEMIEKFDNNYSVAIIWMRPDSLSDLWIQQELL